jgi:thiosulfate dehydrogenase
MRTFLAGLILAIVLLIAGVFFYFLNGYIDPRADAPITALEEKIAMPALDAAVDRHAPEIQTPILPTDDNLTAAITLYQNNCATCHGDPVHPHAQLADAFNPRAPQFLEDAPDMPENQNFYILQHGVRFSGMPAWSTTLNTQQLWQLTVLLSYINKLSPQLTAAWKTAATTPASQLPPTPQPMPMPMSAPGKKSMPMPAP